MTRSWVPALAFLLILGIAFLLIFVVTLRPWGGPDRGWNTHLNFGAPPDTGYGRTPLTWVSAEPGALAWKPSAKAGDDGEALYVASACAGCHRLDASGTSWAPLDVKQAGRVRLLVRSGPEGMPAYKEEAFSDHHLDAVTTYLLEKKGVIVAPPKTEPTPVVAATPTPSAPSTPVPTGPGFQPGGVRAEFASLETRFKFPGDWSAVASNTVTVFYPGQASWEWLTSTEHRGRRDTTSGAKACSDCHADDGDEKFLGGDIIQGGANLEPTPIEGKKPWTEVAVQAAYDASDLYLRLEWAAQNPEPGIYGDAWRFDGKEWVKAGGPAPYNKPALAEDRVSIILGNADLPAADGSKATFGSGGCFITCHSSMANMPAAPLAADVQADPYLGTGGLGSSEVRKYILLSRTQATDASAGWNKVKPQSVLDQLMAAGQFLDLLTVRMHRTAIQGWADDAVVLDYRREDEGKGMFRDTAAPEFSLVEAKYDTGALRLADFNKDGVPYFIKAGDTEAWRAFDASKSNWLEGQAVPSVVLQEPDGSRANVQAIAKFANGRWRVEIKRPLNTGNRDDQVLATGKTYVIGIAVHDDNVAGRQHFVSFPVTLGLGAPGKIEAVSLK